ncbi:putative serine-TYPE carboxypeptidase F precursor [Phyllosticta capitalensis]|uniref:Carboxypeptidase n=1 Tax=Phyllosticta capitalensis TaxID=121624 RepID=A0ABR1YLL5_9PEZI
MRSKPLLCIVVLSIIVTLSSALAPPHLRARASKPKVRRASPDSSPRDNVKRGIHLNEKTEPFRVDGSAFPDVKVGFPETYAGLIPIDKGPEELFFWYVPSENPAAKDEITIWLSGGPGCSSLAGFFRENGPVTWMPGTFAPVKNSWSWTNLTNMVWIDQPLGTGFSVGKPTAKDEIELAKQFAGFWKNFIDTFSLHGRRVYVTGESYAGYYVSYISDYFIEQNNTEYFNVSGIALYDPSIGYRTIDENVATIPFIEYNKASIPLNESFTQRIREKSAKCGFDEYINYALQFPPLGPLKPPKGMFDNGTVDPDCDIQNEAINATALLHPCFDAYIVGQPCPLLWDVLGFPYTDFYFPEGYENPYFNDSRVKKLLHVPETTSWSICAEDPVFATDSGDDLSPPPALPGGSLARVAEHTKNVVVAHGALDMVIMLNGTLMTLNQLEWAGGRGFSHPPDRPFYVPYHVDADKASWAGAGVFGSWTADRGITYVGVALSGHMVPEYTPSAAFRTLELLLGRVANLSDTQPFTTPYQRGIVQPDVPLGRGTIVAQAQKVVAGLGYAV